MLKPLFVLAAVLISTALVIPTVSQAANAQYSEVTFA